MNNKECDRLCAKEEHTKNLFLQQTEKLGAVLEECDRLRARVEVAEQMADALKLLRDAVLIDDFIQSDEAASAALKAWEELK